VQDLGLASLDLVELAAGFEEEFGIGLPEERLADATVADLERAAEVALAGGGESVGRAAAPVAGIAAGAAASAAHAAPDPGATGGEPGGAAPGGVAPISLAGGAPGALRMPRWARCLPLHWLRRALEELFYRPIVLLYGRPKVIGLEHLATAEPPYLIVSNHHSYFDTGLFKTVLPRPLRGLIAPGMTTRYHRVYFGEVHGSRTRCLIEGLQASLVEFFIGAWPLPETAGFRKSVVYAGELADAGWSILIYPEGRHVPEGTLEPFRGGIGMFARDLRAPVIPAFVEGTHPVLPDDAWWPRFGRTRVVFGPPLSFAPDADAAEITARLEAAVRALSRSGGNSGGR
jgi:1-acyl-sn-glycerol-3-phosphate acyltransferase